MKRSQQPTRTTRARPSRREPRPLWCAARPWTWCSAAHSAKQSAQRLGWAGVCTWRSRGKVRGKSRACLHGSPHVVEYSTVMILRGSRCYAQTYGARLAHLSSWRSGRKARGARVTRCVGSWGSRWRARRPRGSCRAACLRTWRKMGQGAVRSRGEVKARPQHVSRFALRLCGFNSSTAGINELQ